MRIPDWMKRITQSAPDSQSAEVVDDEPEADQAENMPGVLGMVLFGMSREGHVSLKQLAESDASEVPGARGRFGIEPSNPIRANGPEGEIVYLERLRTQAGSRLFYHRVGTTNCQALPGVPVDIFEVISTDRSHRAKLHFVMYSFARSRIAPNGYSLLSWRQMSEPDRTLAKLGLFGSTSRVDPFPAALPRVVGARLKEKGLPGESVERLIGKLEGILAGQ